MDNFNLNLIRNKKVLASISGGVDSMVMLDILNKNKDKFNYELEVFHFNHLTRDGKSDEDSNFVKSICASLDLSCHIYRDSMIKYAKENKVSEEDAGRILRKKAISSILGTKIDSWILATAHNLDDQVETILMRIIRGTGIDGLIGMEVFEDNIFRPLLNFTKSEIFKYQEKNCIDYVQDESNFKNEYTRNSIRNELIPLIKKRYNEKFDLSLIKLSQLAREDKKYIDENILKLNENIIIESTKNKFVYKKNTLRKLSKFEIVEILRQNISKINKSNYQFEKSHYDEILKILYSEKSVDITLNGIIFYNSFDNFIIRKKLLNELKNPIKFAEKKCELRLNGYWIRVNLDLVNLEKNDIIIRSRKNGDRLSINGKSIKIKDFFIEQKIDKYERSLVPIIEVNQEIICVGDIYKSKYYNEEFYILKEKVWENRDQTFYHFWYQLY